MSSATDQRGASWEEVSEDVYNRSDSWYYVGVYRTTGALARVEIRANAYERQSHAMVSVWTGEGWTFHTSIPTGEWYASAPSYTRRELDDVALFITLRDRLLRRLADALWNAGGPVTISREGDRTL
jgi:hypothetical protein